jgi:hypothetical protein
MVKTSTTILFLYAFLLLLTRCQSEIEPDLTKNYAGDKLTLQGSISSDSVRIQLSQSLSPFETHNYDDFFVKNGKIMVKDETGTTLSILQSSDNFTFIDRKKDLFKIGKKYKVFASADGLPSVETDWVVIPEKTIQTLDIQQIGERDGRYTALVKDEPMALNYYHSVFIPMYKGKLYTVYRTAENNECIPSATFNDKCFDGTTLNLSFLFPAFVISAGFTKVDTVFYRFGNVSEEAFLLSESKKTNGEIGLGGSEPIPSYSNVKNGYGVVFGQNWESGLFLIK